ncbi:hypothetical protein WJ69_34225 [Burkholderia ubonensis]|uniref:InvB/SpaK family type III secretion system chaperone n=1 Tax=Burkholderia ubonensis TaxID=101571 RepID=UPI000753A05D|nr:hypothetical protein [Burkholderia ubonensis]KVN98515.1 hypothetical protein WJ69_34225 [Burkholderia ubonensis]
MIIDIVKLVRDAMEKIGCGSAVDAEMDAHSPICISLKSLPEMFVEVQDESVLLWSKLDCAGEAHLARVAADLVGYFVPRQSAAFVCRRSLLSLTEDCMALHAVVKADYLSNTEKFVEALEIFFADLCATHEILAQ